MLIRTTENGNELTVPANSFPLCRKLGEERPIDALRNIRTYVYFALGQYYVASLQKESPPRLRLTVWVQQCITRNGTGALALLSVWDCFREIVSAKCNDPRLGPSVPKLSVSDLLPWTLGRSDFWDSCSFILINHEVNRDAKSARPMTGTKANTVKESYIHRAREWIGEETESHAKTYSALYPSMLVCV